MKVGVLFDASALIGYAHVDLPVALAFGELVSEVIDNGEIAAVSALSVHLAYEQLSEQSPRRLLDELLEPDLPGLLILPFTGEDARQVHYPGIGRRVTLADMHTATLAVRLDADVATADAQLFSRFEGIGVLDLSEKT